MPRKSVRFVILERWAHHHEVAIRRHDMVTVAWLSALFAEVCEEAEPCKS